MVKGKPTGIYYWNKPNFGDQINRMIIDELLADHGEFCEFDTCDLMAAGSLLERFLSSGKLGKADRDRQKKCLQDQPCHIWGSGLLYQIDPSENKLVRPLVFHALRGERTRHLMEEITGEKIECVLADPGLLASLFVPAEEKKYSVGIVAHYKEEQLPVFSEMKNHYPGSILISVTQQPEEVFRQISQCEYIISTSLHGIIVADTYGVKNCWCEASELVFGNGMKFHDYFSSFKTDREPFDLRSGAFPELNKDFCLSYSDPDEVKIKQIELINAMPFEVNQKFVTDDSPIRAILNEAVQKNLAADSVRLIQKGTLPEQPLVSIVVPVYNTKDFLGESIESYLSQWPGRCEVILVDDGSYDGSLETAKEYADRDSRITLVTERNSTQGFARNIGVLLARGEYIYFGDSDDLLMPDAIKIMYENAKADDLDLLTFSASVIAEEGVSETRLQNYSEKYHRAHAYEGILTGPQLFTQLFENQEYSCVPYLMFLKKDFLLQNELLFTLHYYHEDELFSYKIFLNAKRVKFIDKVLYKRRLRGGSVMMSPSTKRNVLGYFYSHLNMLELIPDFDLTDEQKLAFRNQAYEMLSAGKKKYRSMKADKDFYLDLPDEERFLFRILFAEDEIAREKSMKNAVDLRTENEKLKKKNAALEKKYNDTWNSVSFKIGRILTWLPRMLRDLIRH